MKDKFQKIYERALDRRVSEGDQDVAGAAASALEWAWNHDKRKVTKRELEDEIAKSGLPASKRAAAYAAAKKELEDDTIKVVEAADWATYKIGDDVKIVRDTTGKNRKQVGKTGYFTGGWGQDDCTVRVDGREVTCKVGDLERIAAESNVSEAFGDQAAERAAAANAKAAEEFRNRHGKVFRKARDLSDELQIMMEDWRPDLDKLKMDGLSTEMGILRGVEEHLTEALKIINGRYKK